jgi:hypothetical protein
MKLKPLTLEEEAKIVELKLLGITKEDIYGNVYRVDISEVLKNPFKFNYRLITHEEWFSIQPPPKPVDYLYNSGQMFLSLLFINDYVKSKE